MSAEASDKRPALHYVGGRWTEGPDLVMDGWSEGSEFERVRSLGYSEVFEIGRRIDGGFKVYRRAAAPRHVIAFEEDELTEFVYVDSIADLMTICGQWSGLVRDIEICQFLRDLSGSETWTESWMNPRDGLVETIARRAVAGSQQPYLHRNRDRDR